MTGIQIRMSRFSGPGARLFDLTAGETFDFKPAALLIYPHQAAGAAAAASGRGGALLLFRLTEWNGERVRSLCEPAAVAPLGGDGCVVDLAAGYEDAAEIESLRLLALTVEQAHRRGLPVLARIRLNRAVCKEDPVPYLEIPLAAAEEMGVDGVILPRIGTGKYDRRYRAEKPLFLAGDDGVIVREA
jgi:hypothetical protein